MRSCQIDEIPAASGFQESMQCIYVKVTAASKRSKVRTLRWLQRTENVPSLAGLESPSSRWDDLDTALAQAIMAVAKGPLKREFTLYAEERMRICQLLAGRAAFWHVYQCFKLDRGMALGIGISVLMQLTFNDDLEAFVPSWDYAMMALKNQPDEDLLFYLLDT